MRSAQYFTRKREVFHRAAHAERELLERHAPTLQSLPPRAAGYKLIVMNVHERHQYAQVLCRLGKRARAFVARGHLSLPVSMFAEYEEASRA